MIPQPSNAFPAGDETRFVCVPSRSTKPDLFGGGAERQPADVARSSAAAMSFAASGWSESADSDR